MLTTLTRIATRHDFRAPIATPIPRLVIWCSAGPTKQTPALFEPKFYAMLQGRKRMRIGGKTLNFEAGSCAVSSVGLPFTTEVIDATPTRPHIGLELKLDAGVLTNLLLDLPPLVDGEAPPFSPAHLSEEVAEPLARLIRLLDTPAEIPVLAASIEREICYRLLQGPMGATLRQIVQKNTRFHQIKTAVEWICQNAERPMRVTGLAASVGMSTTSFHRHFKAVTAYTPLAYQRHVRLLDAQRLILSGESNVTGAAFATGYLSSSQFSREYKRMFGIPPNRDGSSASRRVEPRTPSNATIPQGLL